MARHLLCLGTEDAVGVGFEVFVLSLFVESFCTFFASGVVGAGAFCLLHWVFTARLPHAICPKRYWSAASCRLND